ncbi:lipase 3-like [Onthophagus taurus]|uniref:lipase 3-like n=1 Tax=Onthophagus taurus TaxID=166361 RepID=UPI000C203728|nr:lipase 3-like [Onthophagus taurus]
MASTHLLLAFLACFSFAYGAHPDIGLSPLELITKYGYPLERHWVTTEDGYILNMHRIPHGLKNADEPNKPPVLIMHGLLSSGADFVSLGPEKAIGFLLADLGYDVWLGNARGTTYSRNHTTLNPDEKDFWMFSWHEIGYYDIAAKVDYILEKNGQDKVFYIGHSQGTTVSYVLLADRPEYNDKMRLVVSLGPAAYMSSMINIFFKVAAMVLDDLVTIIEGLGWYELLSYNETMSHTITELCAEGADYQEICASLLFMICGYNLPQVNYTTLPVLMSNVPAGISYRQLIHYGQEINSKRFTHYDFGAEQNLEIYGQEDTPDYDISAITAPVALFYSDNDWICDTKDVEQLHSELPNPALLHKNEDERFNHVDFMWANDIVPLLNVHIIDIMSKY